MFTTTVCEVALTGVLGGGGPLPVTDAVLLYHPTAPSAGVSLWKHVYTSDWFACSDCGPGRSSFAGEDSDFVRFNHACIRQAMTIRQAHLTLSLVDGARSDTTTRTPQL